MARRRIWFRLGLVGTGGILALLLLESCLWLFDPGRYGELEERDRFSAAILARGDDGVLRGRPGARSTYLGHDVMLGSHGLRNPEVVSPKPKDVFRIVVAGDSVPFGWGVAEDEAFPRVLERALRDRPRADGRRYEVVNGGTPGFGLVEAYVWLRDHGLAMQPNVVLHCVIANDVDPLPALPLIALSPALRSIRTLRLVERLADDFTRTTATQPNTGLSPEQLTFALDRLVDLCRDKTRWVYLDTIGQPAAVAHCRTRGIPRVDAVVDGAWVVAHAVRPTDPHPNATGHAWIAQRILDQLAAVLGE